MLAALPKSAHQGALVAIREISNAEDVDPGAGRDQGVRDRLRREVSESGRQRSSTTPWRSSTDSTTDTKIEVTWLVWWFTSHPGG